MYIRNNALRFLLACLAVLGGMGTAITGAVTITSARDNASAIITTGGEPYSPDYESSPGYIAVKVKPTLTSTPIYATSTPEPPISTPIAPTSTPVLPTSTPIASPTSLPGIDPLSKPGYTLAFHDEFTGTVLDRSLWDSDYPNGGGGELQEYVNDDSHANYKVSEGVLTLRAYSETVPYQGRSYTSGVIDSDPSLAQAYGYFEVRAKLPKGKGLWPAIWMMPQGAPSNYAAEIDNMESLGDPTIAIQNYHWAWNTKATGSSRATITAPAFHVYGTEWRPNGITWTIDGVIVRTFISPTLIYTQPMMMILNLAVGGHWPGNPDATTVFPADFQIDYVRVWQFDDLLSGSVVAMVGTDASLPKRVYIPLTER